MATPIRPPLLSRDSGPGLRWLLFLQGCRSPCTDQCLNPHYLNPAGGHVIPFDEIRLQIDQVQVGTYGVVEGITLLGGEPTDQAEALLPVLEHSRQANLSVMLYSGKPYAWFVRPANGAAQALLPLVDILVDGPFLPTLASPGLRWRGSTNQQIRLLSSRYTPEQIACDQEKVGVTLNLPAQGLPIISGLQTRNGAAAVEQILQNQAPQKPASALDSPT